MGGEISVASEPGKGSTFTVILPAVVSDKPSHTELLRKPSEPLCATSGPQSAILVIDDDPAVHDLLRRSLEKDGFRIESAGDGRSGIELAKRLRPVVIILDVMMPSMDGWAVLSALKADSATVDIPVIMMTIVDDKQMGFALGAADYFTKPIDWQRLHGVLQKYRKPIDQQTVLVVEDEPQTRELLRRALEKEGWRVLEAANGKLGLEQLDGTVPGLILLDLMMPEMDGFEFMQELRKKAAFRLVPVIVITAKDLSDEDRKHLNGEVARIVQKSALPMEDLMAEVMSVTGLRRKNTH
jgi:DNA-binding response OmpR family regulator